jgi:CubicO group peptidase (beta-lactamase class C family)
MIIPKPGIRFIPSALMMAALLAACAPPTPPLPTVPAATPTAVVTPTAEPGLALDGYLSSLNDQDLFTGSVLVARNGEVLLAKGYGLADEAQGVPNTPQTKFRIGQLTTPLTTMAIMLLQAEGKLDVQDSVCDYMADCPSGWQAITLHHLLTSTGGIYPFVLLPEFRDGKATPVAVTEVIDLLRAQPFDSDARWRTDGEGTHYNHSDFFLLGAIIEQVSGQTYGQFLRERILDPLGMTRSGYDEDLDGLALGYRRAADIAVADLADPSWMYAAAGLFSTVEDLYRFDQALYTERLVPQAALDAVFTEHVTLYEVPGSGTGYNYYGYGWAITTVEGHCVIWHWGNIDGYSSYLGRYVDDGLTVIVLSNQEGLSMWGQGQFLAQMVLEP